MKLDIVSIIKDIGASIEFSQSERIEDLKDGIGTIEFTGPATFSGKVTSLNGMVKLEGKASVDYRTICDRCGEPVERTISVPVKEDIVEIKDGEQTPANSDSNERFSFSGHILDLNSILADAVILNLPMRHLCREDCPGSLYGGPMAGRSGVSADDRPTDPRFESLKDYYKE